MNDVPKNIEAEKTLLTTLIHDSGIANKLASLVHPKDFFDEANKTIYEALLTLEQTGTTISTITLKSYLKSNDLLAKAGGVTTVLDVAAQKPCSEEQALEHAKLIANTAKHRNAAEILEDIQNNLSGVEEKDAAILATAGSRVLDLATANDKFVSITPQDGSALVLNDIRESIKRDGKLVGLSSGLNCLDNLIFGFEPTKLYVIAARPGVGKTSLGLNIAANVAIQQRQPVLMFSLEMSAGELYTRLYCGRAGVDSTKVKLGLADDLMLDMVERECNACKDAPLQVDDRTRRTIDDIRLRSLQFIRQCSSDSSAKPLIIVDYLQLVSADTKRNENREREVAKVSVGLKSLAKELNVPIISLAQLKRSDDTKKYPTLKDLRESGSIEQDADAVVFIHKIQDQSETEAEESGDSIMDDKNMKLIVAKNRSGPLGILDVVFQATYTRFVGRVTADSRNPMNYLFEDMV